MASMYSQHHVEAAKVDNKSVVIVISGNWECETRLTYQEPLKHHPDHVYLVLDQLY